MVLVIKSSDGVDGWMDEAIDVISFTSGVPSQNKRYTSD